MTRRPNAGPLHRVAPPRARTNGDIAAGVGADLGLVPDAEQRWLLDAIYAENDEGLPASYEVGVVAPRQNLKSATLEIAALTDLYVYGIELAVWTAHEFKTARKSFEDMRRRILRHPDYAKRTDFRDSHGEEAIFLDTGERLEFHARSGGSGRGFTCSKLTLDEAMYLQPGDLGALVPTMFTIADAQVRYGSSAGKSSSAALRAIRDRGRNPRDDDSLAYVEYGAPRHPCRTDRCTHAVGSEGCALDDRDLWWSANCALWAGRATEKAVERQRLALPPPEFAREFLSWWEDPVGEGSAFDPVLWSALIDTEPQMGSPVFGVATAPDRSWSAITAAWRRPDGLLQLLVGDDYRPAATWVPDRIAELQARWGGRVIVDTASRGLIPGAEEPSEGEQAKAHNAFSDALLIAGIRHGNEPALNTAVRAARWKSSGNTRVLDRKGSTDISPLIAAALAVYGVTTAPTSTGWMVSLP